MKSGSSRWMKNYKWQVVSEGGAPENHMGRRFYMGIFLPLEGKKRMR